MAVGTLRCWGSNAYGQLGDGTLAPRLRPAVVKASPTTALVGVTAVSAGATSACAVLSTGAVRCWGLNTFGQLGNNSAVAARDPVPVAGIDGVHAKATTVSVGNGFACARMADGTARCWGRNGSGELANGASANSRIPVVVSTAPGVKLTAITSIAAGGSHVCATVGASAVATVRCWGLNAAGQLGTGSTVLRRWATSVAGTTTKGVKSIATGGSHTLALVPSVARPPSGAVGWGMNVSGQLGIGTTTNRLAATALLKL
jgi:alpha-tubulin suppressor-like RCC1 family protein